MDLEWCVKRKDHLVVWSQDVITLYQVEEIQGGQLRQGCKLTVQ